MKHIISFALRVIPRKYIQLFAHYIARILGVFYLGKKVQCPVCKHTYRKFLPYGRLSASRPNALCPGCLSLERHRMIWYYIKHNTSFFSQSQSMLHIAPEYPFISRFKQLSHLKYITGDLESPLADVKLDVLEIPFENEAFDIVFCNHVLEHIPDDAKAMQEIYRILKPKGWAILQVPLKPGLEVTDEDFSITSPRDREKRFGQKDHVRWYGLDYKNRLEKVGFKVKVYKPYYDDKQAFDKHVFLKEEFLYHCEKIV